MKNLYRSLLITLVLLLTGTIVFAQTIILGTAGNFVLFTSVGAITNTGISQITGNVGSNSGAGTGFGNVNGVMHSGNLTTSVASANLSTAYNQLNAAIPNFFVAPLLGNGDTLLPGVYHITNATTLNGNLILNGQGDSNAVFIFQIQAAFSTNAGSKVKLINGAMACNVFWKVEGLVDMATGTYMRGTIVANNAGINIGSLDTLEGRALSTTGAISINGVMAYTPLGCGSPTLIGPVMPTLGSAACYTLFTGNGSMTNSGISPVTGDVGTNVGLTTGFDPLLVNGTIHPVPDGSTAAAASDLLNAANLMDIMPYDIELLYPAQFGNNLVLTPHTYLLNAATVLTGNIYLNAQGNTNAVFFIKIYGALSTSVSANVILINGAQANHVHWLVSGAVGINDNSIFNGTLVSINGAVSTLSTGVQISGRFLTTNGAFSATTVNAISFSLCFPLPLDWLYFDGKAKGSEVVLTWGAGSEINNDYFMIEKSEDGLVFEDLSKVKADDSSMSVLNDYQFIDHQPFPITYYRISQIDIDGRSNAYKTIKVTSSHDGFLVTSFTSGSYININISNASTDNGSIELFTMDGRKISTKEVLLKNEFNQYQINKPAQPGIYLLKLTSNDKTIYSGKVMVQ